MVNPQYSFVSIIVSKHCQVPVLSVLNPYSSKADESIIKSNQPKYQIIKASLHWNLVTTVYIPDGSFLHDILHLLKISGIDKVSRQSIFTANRSGQKQDNMLNNYGLFA